MTRPDPNQLTYIPPVIPEPPTPLPDRESPEMVSDEERLKGLNTQIM